MATKTETPVTETERTQTCRTTPTGTRAQLSASCEQAATNQECDAQVCCNAIRERAYYKWEQAGYPEGDGANFWLEAETELQAETTTPATE